MRKIGRLLMVVVTFVALSGVSHAASLEDVRTRIHENGSGDWMRKHFFKDMEPIALTPGGAGTLVVLYSKKRNLSIPLCTSFDVIMGVKKGKVTSGWNCGSERCAD